MLFVKLKLRTVMYLEFSLSDIPIENLNKLKKHLTPQTNKKKWLEKRWSKLSKEKFLTVLWFNLLKNSLLIKLLKKFKKELIESTHWNKFIFIESKYFKNQSSIVKLFTINIFILNSQQSCQRRKISLKSLDNWKC